MRTERHPNGAVTSVALRLALFLAAGVWFLPAPAAAQVTWTGTTSSNWSTTTNWASSTAPASGGTGDLFFNASSNVAVTATNNLASTYTAGNITFNTGSFTLSGSAIALTGSVTTLASNLQTMSLGIDLGSSDRTFNIFGSNFVLSGRVFGTGGIVKTGNGTLILDGTNDFSGNMSVQAGNLRLGNNNANATVPSGTISLAGSGRLVIAYPSGNRIFNNTITTSATTSSGGALSIEKGGTSTFRGNVQVYTVTSNTSTTGTAGPVTFEQGKLTLGGTYATGASTTGTTAPSITVWGAPITITSTISYGPGASSSFMTKSGTGTLYMGNAAATDINKIAVGGGTLDIVGTLQSTFKNAGIQFTGTSDNVLQMSGTYAPSTWGGAPFQVGWNSSSYDGGFAARGGALTVTLPGSGTATYQAAASFKQSDGMIASGRTLIFGSPTADNVVTLINPLNFNSGTQTIKVIGNGNGNNYAVLSGALSNGGLTKDGTGLLRLTGTNTYAGATAVNSGTLAIGSAGQLVGTTGTYAGDMTVAASTAFQYDSSANSTLSGAISGAGAVIQTGAGRLTLLGANSYSGGTTLSAGELEFANGGLGSTGTVTLNGGTLRWATGNMQDISARLALVSGSTATLDTNNNTVTFGNAFIGSSSASLTKTGSGTLVINALNTYTGTTTMTAGTLSAGHASALGNGGDITFTGGTLQYTGSSANQDWGSRIKGSSSAIAIDTNIQSVSLGALASSNVGGLTKTGAGTLTLTGSNGYTGATTVNAGTLSGASNALANTSSITVNGATLSAVNYNSSASLSLDSSGLATISGTGLSLGAVTNANTSANALDFTGNTGTITLTSLSGAGNTRFRAGASIGGTVSQGSVTIDGVGTLGTVSGGTIGLNGDSASITTLSGGRIDLANNVVLSVQDGRFGGTITGAGSLKKTGSGRLTLTGSQSYTGSTIISGGTLALGAGASLVSTPTIVVGDAGSTGAVLDLTAQGGAGKTVTFNTNQKVMGKGTIDLAGATLRVLGTLAPGNSPGTLTINGDLQWQSSDAGYQWEINDATGTAGTNWDLLTVSGALDLSALSSSNRYLLDLTTLTLSNTAGQMASYIDGDRYTWSLVSASSVLLASGTAAAGMDITSLFNLSFANWANSKPSVGNYSVKVASDGAGINLVIIPEPDTIIFAGIGIVMAGWSLWKRRRILQK